MNKDFKNQFGDSVVNFGNVKSNLGDSFISSGSRALNLIMTGHPEIGLVSRRIYEYYGPESCGKSTLAEESVADCQRKGGKALYIDAEHALDPTYMRNIGVNLKKLDIGEPDSGEQAFEMIEWGIDNYYDLIVFDSIAALSPLAEIQGDIGDSNMGVAARLMGQGLRRVVNDKLRKDKRTSLIFINQLRMKIGVVFGNPETTPGGNALKYFSTIRLDMRTPRKDKTVEAKEEVGKKITVKTVKNKIYPPFKTCKVHLTYGSGVDKVMDFLECMKILGVVDYTKKQIAFKNLSPKQKFFSASKINIASFRKKLLEDKDFRKVAKDLLLEKSGWL